MVEDWIDDLTKVWGGISLSAPFGASQVRSYNMVTDANFPESLDPSDLDKTPIALTFPPSLAPVYSRGGPIFGTWTGVTEFHLAPDFTKARIRELLPWYKRIWNAAAGNPLLNNKVALFIIPDEPDAISNLMSLKYGDESPHWGIVVKWTVKEHVETQITVGGPL